MTHDGAGMVVRADQLRSREAWLKDGRVVKVRKQGWADLTSPRSLTAVCPLSQDDAVPAKLVKAPKAASPKGRGGARAVAPAVAATDDGDEDGDGGGGTQVDASALVDGTPLFGIWQTDVYTPRTATNVRIARSTGGGSAA